MRPLLITIAIVCGSLTAFTQNTALNGSWAIYQFNVINNGEENITSENDIKENGSVWNIMFKEDQTFKQTSNMRNGSDETFNGNWRTDSTQLLLNIQVEDRFIDINYDYEIVKDDLILRRQNPTGTMKMTIKFRKQ